MTHSPQLITREFCEFRNSSDCDILRTLPSLGKGRGPYHFRILAPIGPIARKMANSWQDSTEVNEEAEVYLHADGRQYAPQVGATTKHGWRKPIVKQGIILEAVRACAWLACIAATGVLAAAVPKSQQLLPVSTVGYISVADPADLDARLKRTQIGQFAEDPSLQPFVDHLRDTIPRRLANVQERVGISLDDLQGVAGGELAWAIVARESGRAASVLLVDTSGNEQGRERADHEDRRLPYETRCEENVRRG